MSPSSANSPRSHHREKAFLRRRAPGRCPSWARPVRRMEEHSVQAIRDFLDRHVHVIGAQPPSPPCTGEPGVRGQNVPIRPSQLEWDILHQLMHLAMAPGLKPGASARTRA